MNEIDANAKSTVASVPKHSPAIVPDQIGLCLSGGGFRAAAFHLGVLAYLDRVGLLSRVTMLSTVSGGTITGAAYAVSLLEKKSFGDFFRDFYQRIEQVRLFKTALRHLGSSKQTETPSGRRNLITSMAETYAEYLFFHEAANRPYRLEDILNGDTGPLSEITFNATDFCTGLAFRFQKSRGGKIGNHGCRLDRDDAGAMRLADIVAASSCFPGGFEPMEFPHDFAWPAGRVPAGVQEKLKHGSISLMDGGVYDNQGIDSLMLADNRHDSRQENATAEAERLDMFIMSDTNQQADNLFPFPQPTRAAGNFVQRSLMRWNPTLGTINVLARSIQFLCALTVVAVCVAAYQSELSWDAVGLCRSIFAFGIPVVLAGVTSLVLYIVRKQIRTAVLPQIPGAGLAAWDDLKRLRIVQVFDMFNLRTRSLLAMASSVFMKRIRQLGYRVIYDDERYAGKRVANFIYDLLSESQLGIAKRLTRRKTFQHLQPAVKQRLESALSQIAEASPALAAVARQAHDTPTTLWFIEPYELPSLVAAGQASMCINLLNWAADVHVDRDLPLPAAGDFSEFWNRLVADWNELANDPYAMLKREFGREGIPLPPGK